MLVPLKPLFFGVTFWGLVQCRQELKSTTSSPLLPESAGYVKAGWGKSAGYLDKYWQPSVGCEQGQHWSLVDVNWLLDVETCWNSPRIGWWQSCGRGTADLWKFQTSRKPCTLALQTRLGAALFGCEHLVVIKHFYSSMNQPGGAFCIFCVDFFAMSPILHQDWSENAGKPPLNGLFNGEDYDQPRNFRLWSTTIPGGWSRPGGVSAPLAGIAGRSQHVDSPCTYADAPDSLGRSKGKVGA